MVYRNISPKFLKFVFRNLCYCSSIQILNHSRSILVYCYLFGVYIPWAANNKSEIENKRTSNTPFHG